MFLLWREAKEPVWNQPLYFCECTYVHRQQLCRLIGKQREKKKRAESEGEQTEKMRGADLHGEMEM